jgi:hypothetical protein
MLPPIDIFKVQPDGQLRWIEGVRDMESAEARVAMLAKESPGPYIIFEGETGKKRVIETGSDDQGTPRRIA